jgi:cytochrome c
MTPLRSCLAVVAALLVPDAAGADVLRGHGGPVRAIVEPAPGTLVTGGFDETLIRWVLKTSTAAEVLRFHAGAVNALAALPDGSVASGGADGKVVVWRPGDASPRHILEGHAGPVAALAASPDGRLLASASWDRTIRIERLPGAAAGDPAPGTAAVLAGHQDNVNGVAFTPDGRAVVSAGYDATVRLWPLDRAGAAAGEARVVALPAAQNAVVVTPDGRILAGGADGVVRRLAPDGTPEAESEPLPTPVIALALAPGGRRLAAAGLLGAVTLYDPKTLGVAATLVGPGLPVWSLAFSADGATLYSGGADRLVRRWDAATGRPLDSIVPEPRAAAATVGEARGETVFRACRACHAVGPDDGNRAGPTLYGLFGRRIGSLPGYPYSEALPKLDIVWSPETVTRLFELGPSVVTPGTRMPEQRISDPADLKALVDWLEKVTR